MKNRKIMFSKMLRFTSYLVDEKDGEHDDDDDDDDIDAIQII